MNGIQEVSGSIPLISIKLSSGNSPFPELFSQGYKKAQEVFLALCDENNQLTVFAME